ncbi:hypothetical protein [Burkholderia gladioli]|uniref:hypothetical protein n=1 Tax=Burkholderia gladioli TaxID=28095 RepID=UPI00163E1D03|nr:hypothetical protein [Burkholderia gladioli]
MSANIKAVKSNPAAVPSNYRARVKAEKTADGNYLIRVDDEIRFAATRVDDWPAFWELRAIVGGVRSETVLETGNEHWDLIESIERGQWWMPEEMIIPLPRASKARIVRERLWW